MAPHEGQSVTLLPASVSTNAASPYSEHHNQKTGKSERRSAAPRQLKETAGQSGAP